MRSSAKKIPELLKLQCPESVWKLNLYIGIPIGKKKCFVNMRYTLFKTFEQQKVEKV